jgi:uncharacterized membrane protein
MVPPSRSFSGTWPIVAAFWAILLMHLGLLAMSLPQYRVTIDSAYHVSMGREFGEHGLVPWDRINFGPRGRPNLQGPLLHAAIGGLGRLLGGRGDDYVLANAILAVVQWLTAMGTAAYFAFRLSGSVAMLLTVALLSGAAFAATSFASGIPSGWLFIFTPWAIWLFVADRTWLSSVLLACAIYSHIGGYLTAPLGIFIAALLTRKWRQLFICGTLTAILTLPYTIHILRYARWISGMKSHSALLFDPMLDVLAVIGAFEFAFAPRDNPFLFAWLLAPIAWLVQDPGRFILQWPLAGSVAAGYWLASRLSRLNEPACTRYAVAIAAMATILPIGLPSISSEAAWAAGNHYPLAVNWRNAHELARTIDRAGLTRNLISHYSPFLCPAIAVYRDITCEKGDWIEVQPRSDPADFLSVAKKTYVVPLAAGDPMLRLLASLGWAEVYSGKNEVVISKTSIVRPLRQPSVKKAAMVTSRAIVAEATWLGRHIVNNSISLTNVWRMSSPSMREQFQRRLENQRASAGRLELACLMYAWALERAEPAQAAQMRRIALDLGVIASYLGDDYAVDFLSDEQIAELRERSLELASRSAPSGLDPSPSPVLMSTFRSLIYSALKNDSEMFAGRPAGDWFPWLS